MKQLFSLLMLLGTVLGMNAENLPISGGYNYAIKNLKGEVKVTFTSQYGEVGLSTALPVSMDNYKGFVVEFTEPVTNNFQVKVQNATDEADQTNWPAQTVEATDGATRIDVTFDADHFGTDRTITVVNLQSKNAGQSCTLKRAALVKNDGTEEECYYNTAAGYNKEVEVYSGDVEFKQQYAQFGMWNGSAGDKYTVKFGSAIPGDLFQWTYKDASNSSKYPHIDAGTEATITMDTDYTGLSFQYYSTSVPYVLNVVSVQRTTSGGGTGGGGESGGGEEQPTDGSELLPISIVQDASIDVSLPVNVTFTQQYGDLGLCKTLPVSVSDYKGFRVEFAEGVVSALQLKVEGNGTTKYILAADGATQIAIDFNEQFGSGTVDVINLQDGDTGHSATITKTVLIKQNGDEEATDIDTSVGYNKQVEAYSGAVTFKKQYAKIGPWVNSNANCDDTYTITFEETIPGNTFQWVYTDSKTHYPEIKEATKVMTLNIKDIAYTNCCLQYKATSEQTFTIKSIRVLHKTATGIDTVETLKHDAALYNLNGVRVEQPTKGIYIQNGKKIVIK